MVTTRSSNLGLTADTTKHFIIDAGAVYLNLGEVDERLLGATRGGNIFHIEQDVKVIDIDGARGAVKGARRIITANAKITANMLELTTANLMLAIAGSSATDWTDPSITPAPGTPSHDQIRRTRNLSDLDFVKNVAIVGKVSGSADNIICTLYNPLVDDKIEMKFDDKNEQVISLVFTAHYDPADVMTEPWSIAMPKIV